MKRIVLLMLSLFLVISVPFVGTAGDVNINVGVSPPPLQFAGPPDVVVVPSESAYVYLVPNTVGLYFYNGYWYRTHGGRWWRSTIYNGGWAYIGPAYVPRAVVAVPPDYVLSMPQGYHHIHYGDFHRNWRNWGHNHYWNTHHWYKDHDRHWGHQYRDHHPGYHAGAHNQGGHQGGQHHQGAKKQQGGQQFQDGQTPQGGQQQTAKKHQGGQQYQAGQQKQAGQQNQANQQQGGQHHQ